MPGSRFTRKTVSQVLVKPFVYALVRQTFIEHLLHAKNCGRWGYEDERDGASARTDPSRTGALIYMLTATTEIHTGVYGGQGGDTGNVSE